MKEGKDRIFVMTRKTLKVTMAFLSSKPFLLTIADGFVY